VGQLLFATRFGTTASCSDYVIHWGAAADTRKQLATDPIGGLGRDGALTAIRAVLDRRTRQIQLAQLASSLGRPPPAAPPAASAIVSLSCLVVDSSSAGASPASPTPLPSGAAPQATGGTIAIDGDAVGQWLRS
jgi:hypothetical protein